MKLAIAALNVSLFCLMAIFSDSVDPSVLLNCYLGAQVVLYGSHLWVLRAARRVDLLDGLNVLNVGFFLHFTLPPLLIYRELMPTYYSDLWGMSDFPRMLVLLHGMCVATQVGYYLRTRWVLRNPFVGLRPEPARIWMFLTVLCVVNTAIGRVPFLDASGLIPSETIHSGPVIMTAALILHLPYFLLIMVPDTKTLSSRLAVWCGLSLSLFLSLFSGIGSKTGVANLFVAWVLQRHMFVRPLRIRHAVLAIVIAASAVTYLNYVRAVGYAAGLTAEKANPFAGDNGQVFMGAGVSSTLTPVEAFLVVLKTFPDMIPYQGGRRLFEDMAYPLLPRLFFPGKPAIYGGAFFWDIHRGFLSLGVGSNSYEAISLPGHFYLDFGWIGVLLGGMLMGAIQRQIYQCLIADRPSRGSVCLYGMLCALSIVAARAFVWTSYTVIASVLLPAVVIRVLQSRAAVKHDSIGIHKAAS